MKTVQHYLKPISKGTAYRAPWAPRAVKEIDLPPLPTSLARYYALYHHAYRFRLGSLTFLSAEEVKSVQGHTLFGRLQFESAFYDPATETVYTSARPQSAHNGTSFDAFVLRYRPRWEDY